MASKKTEVKPVEVKPIIQPAPQQTIVSNNKTIELTEKEIKAIKKAIEIAHAGFPPSGLVEILDGIVQRL